VECVSLEKLSKEKITSLTILEAENRVVSTSMDGFVKSVELPHCSAKKSYFVSESGISAATQLQKPDSFALAALNHNVYLFSFVTGTVVANFYAHDDTINDILFSQELRKLVTCSADQTVKLWDLGKGGDFSADAEVFYDHEEEIVSASLSRHILASVDFEANLLFRDLR